MNKMDEIKKAESKLLIKVCAIVATSIVLFILVCYGLSYAADGRLGGLFFIIAVMPWIILTALLINIIGEESQRKINLMKKEIKNPKAKS